MDVPVIFITAFPERLLTGERPEPTFLITKPFQPETVKAAISQALFFHPSRQKEAA
jgi:two-component SAPR family response regulator